MNYLYQVVISEIIRKTTINKRAEPNALKYWYNKTDILNSKLYIVVGDG